MKTFLIAFALLLSAQASADLITDSSADKVNVPNSLEQARAHSLLLP